MGDLTTLDYDQLLARAAPFLAGQHLREQGRDRLGRFAGGGGGLTGQAALDAVPATLTPDPGAHMSGSVENATLDGPPGMGSARALSEYEGVEYHATNQHLRSGPTDLTDLSDEEVYPGAGYSRKSSMRERNAETAARIAEIDKTMAASRLQEDIVVERGFTRPKAAFGEAWHGDVVEWDDFDHGTDRWDAGERPNLTGLRFTDRAYVSTSADHENRVADQFVDRTAKFQRESSSGPGLEGEPVVMRIAVPKGTGAVELSPLGQRDDRGRLMTAAEILLDRGLTMEVTADHGVDDGGIRRLDVQVVTA